MKERCICGAYVRNVFESVNTDVEPEARKYVWVHVAGSDTACTEVRRIADILPDRKLTQGAAEQMSILMNRTRRAAGELENMQGALAELREGVAGLAEALVQPATIRRVTLMEAWDALVSSGNLDGARLVRDMIRGL